MPLRQKATHRFSEDLEKIFCTRALQLTPLAEVAPPGMTAEELNKPGADEEDIPDHMQHILHRHLLLINTRR